MGTYDTMDPEGDNTWGNVPLDGNNAAAGPYAHITTGPAGLMGGFGLWNGPVAPGQSGLSAQLLSANFGLGQFVGSAGESNVGASADFAVAKGGFAPCFSIDDVLNTVTGASPYDPWDVPFGDIDIGLEGSLLDGNAGIFGNKDVFSMGAQANIASVAGTFGDAEESIKIGGSLGTGLGFRVHHGDNDNGGAGDGILEAGFGIDAGPVSFDIKSETLGRMWEDPMSTFDILGEERAKMWDEFGY